MRMPVPPPARRKAPRSISSDGIADMKKKRNQQESSDTTPKPTKRSISNDGLTAMRMGIVETTTTTTTAANSSPGEGKNVGSKSDHVAWLKKKNTSGMAQSSLLSRSSHVSQHTSNQPIQKEEKSKSLAKEKSKCTAPKTAFAQAMASMAEKKKTLEPVADSIEEEKKTPNPASENKSSAVYSKANSTLETKGSVKSPVESVGSTSKETAATTKVGQLKTSDNKPKPFQTPAPHSPRVSVGQLRAKLKSFHSPEKAATDVRQLKESPKVNVGQLRAKLKSFHSPEKAATDVRLLKETPKVNVGQLRAKLKSFQAPAGKAATETSDHKPLPDKTPKGGVGQLKAKLKSSQTMDYKTADDGKPTNNDHKAESPPSADEKPSSVGQLRAKLSAAQLRPSNHNKQNSVGRVALSDHKFNSFRTPATLNKADKLAATDHQPKPFQTRDKALKSVGRLSSSDHKLKVFQTAAELPESAGQGAARSNLFKTKSFASERHLLSSASPSEFKPSPGAYIKPAPQISNNATKPKFQTKTRLAPWQKPNTPVNTSSPLINTTTWSMPPAQTKNSLQSGSAAPTGVLGNKADTPRQAKSNDSSNVSETVEIEEEVVVEDQTEIEYEDETEVEIEEEVEVEDETEVEIEEEVEDQTEVEVVEETETEIEYAIEEDFLEEEVVWEEEIEEVQEEFTDTSYVDEPLEEENLSTRQEYYPPLQTEQTTKMLPKPLKVDGVANVGPIKVDQEAGSSIATSTQRTPVSAFNLRTEVMPQSTHSEGPPSLKAVRPSGGSRDPLSPVTCHLPQGNGPRSGSSQESSAPVSEAPAPPPIQVSRRVRQLAKALENSFMLTKDDAIKLFNDIYGVIKGNRTKQLEFGVGKGVKGFLKVLKEYEEHLAVLEVGFLIIAELAEVDTNRDALALNGCIEFVLISMLAHEKSLVLQETGCYAVAGLAKTRKYQEWIVASSGIQVIVTIQSAFKSNVKIQTACLCALHNLARDNKENVFSITAKGGVRSLMDIVKLPEHAKELDFQREACAIMATLARTNDSNRGAIAAAGGIETTLKALKTFPDKPDLQAVGLDALYCLCDGHSQNCDSIVAKGGIDTLVQKMKIYESHLELQESGMKFARLLTERGTTAKKFVAAGGIKIVLMAMRHFEDSHIIQDNGCATLLNMAMQKENKETICGAGGIGIIVMAMKKLSSNSVVQKNGCKALESLAINDQNKKSIAAGGGITAIMSAMKTHEGIPALQGLAVSALRKLASVGRNRTTMNVNGCIETVERAMKSNPNNTFLHNNGDALLILLDPSRAKDD